MVEHSIISISSLIPRLDKLHAPIGAKFASNSELSQRLELSHSNFDHVFPLRVLVRVIGPSV